MGRGTPQAQATRQGNVRSGRRSDPKPRPGKATQKGPAVAEELTPALGRVFIQTVLHFCPELPQWLAQLNDTRFQDFVVYDKRFLFWYALLVFVCKLRSLRQLDFQFRRMPKHVLPNLNRLAGTGQKTLPVWRTVSHFLGHVGLKAVCEIRTLLMRALVRSKILNPCRLLNRYFVVAIDGTGWISFLHQHCKHCLTYTHGKITRYRHMVLEAKLVSCIPPLALSMGTEFIENQDLPHGRSRQWEKVKQDCELNAMKRLLPSLRADYPRMPLCITSDSLHACGDVMDLAGEYDCRYILVFKSGRTPALWAEFQSLLKQSPQNDFEHRIAGGIVQRYRWTDDLHYTDSKGGEHVLGAIQCDETTPDGVTTTYAWITDLPVNRATVIEIASRGGRPRWKIENQGFNMQKNSDLNLKHPYSQSLEIAKMYYVLLQIAHVFLQLVETGSLLSRLAQQHGSTVMKLVGSIKNIAEHLRNCMRYFCLSDDVFTRRRIRVGFNTS